MSLELLGARHYLGADPPAPSLDDVRAGRGVIQEGMRGPSVEYIQKKAGLTGSSASGLFGPETTAAVKSFQAGMELPGSGTVDKDTLEALDGAYLVPEKAPALSSQPQNVPLDIVRFPVPAAPKRPAPAPAPKKAEQKSGGSSFWSTLASLFKPAPAPAWQPSAPVETSVVPYVAGGAGLFAILLALILRRSS